MKGLPRESDATVHMKSEARVTLYFIIYINFYLYDYLREVNSILKRFMIGQLFPQFNKNM